MEIVPKCRTFQLAFYHISSLLRKDRSSIPHHHRQESPPYKAITAAATKAAKPTPLTGVAKGPPTPPSTVVVWTITVCEPDASVEVDVVALVVAEGPELVVDIMVVVEEEEDVKEPLFVAPAAVNPHLLRRLFVSASNQPFHSHARRSQGEIKYHHNHHRRSPPKKVSHKPHSPESHSPYSALYRYTAVRRRCC